jgi:hypothetical protein
MARTGLYKSEVKKARDTLLAMGDALCGRRSHRVGQYRVQDHDS